MSQAANNTTGNFNVQQFRRGTILYLLDNNLPIELLERVSFQVLMNLPILKSKQHYE
jgi:hypothetical protein